MPKLKVNDLMTHDVIAVRRDEPLAVLHRLMSEHHIRHVPVVDPDGNLAGVVSHRDLLRHAFIEQAGVPKEVEQAVLERIEVSELMSSSVASVGPDTDLRQAAQLMLEHKYGCVPVVVGRKLVGILTESDFVRLMAAGN